MGKVIQFQRPDGKSVDGYLAEPSGAAGAPGVIVIQEWWGLNDQIRGVADRLAAAGFTALVPDLYRGKSTVEAEEAHHLMSHLNFGDAASMDVRGAVQALKARGAPRVGVTGYCMGGALTVLALTMAPEADAGVVWYGYPPLEFVDASKISAPMMAHWATQDAAFAIDKCDGQGDGRVLHPHRNSLLPGENKNHTGGLGEPFAEHQALASCFGSVGEFGADRVLADPERVGQ